MGYIKSSGMRLTRNGLKRHWTIDEVLEAPGKYRRVTRSKGGKPFLAYGDPTKPMRFGIAGGGLWIVYATPNEARRGEAQ